MKDTKSSGNLRDNIDSISKDASNGENRLIDWSMID